MTSTASRRRVAGAGVFAVAALACIMIVTLRPEPSRQWTLEPIPAPVMDGDVGIDATLVFSSPDGITLVDLAGGRAWQLMGEPDRDGRRAGVHGIPIVAGPQNLLVMRRPHGRGEMWALPRDGGKARRVGGHARIYGVGYRVQDQSGLTLTPAGAGALDLMRFDLDSLELQPTGLQASTGFAYPGYGCSSVIRTAEGTALVVVPTFPTSMASHHTVISAGAVRPKIDDFDTREPLTLCSCGPLDISATFLWVGVGGDDSLNGIWRVPLEPPDASPERVAEVDARGVYDLAVSESCGVAAITVHRLEVDETWVGLVDLETGTTTWVAEGEDPDIWPR